jgi:PadR family transcriptional regulator, regulatory protein PadR
MKASPHGPLASPPKHWELGAAILAALVPGRGFGLELIDRVRERTNGAIKLNEGTVYPTLKAMEREGLLRSFDGEPVPERGGRPRRVTVQQGR